MQAPGAEPVCGLRSFGGCSFRSEDNSETARLNERTGTQWYLLEKLKCECEHLCHHLIPFHASGDAAWIKLSSPCCTYSNQNGARSKMKHVFLITDHRAEETKSLVFFFLFDEIL